MRTSSTPRSSSQCCCRYAYYDSTYCGYTLTLTVLLAVLLQAHIAIVGTAVVTTIANLRLAVLLQDQP